MGSGIGWRKFFLFEIVFFLFLYSYMGFYSFPGLLKALRWQEALYNSSFFRSFEIKYGLSIGLMIFVLPWFSILFVLISPHWLRKIEKRKITGLPIFRWLLFYNILLIPIIFIGGNLLISLSGEYAIILGLTIFYGAFLVPIAVILFSVLPALLYLFFYSRGRALKIVTVALAIGLGLSWGGLAINVTTCSFNRSGLCVYHKAEKANNIQICNKLPENSTEDGAVYCRDKFLSQTYKTPPYTDWKICNQLSTEWKYQCLYNMAIKLSDALPCDNMAPDYYLTNSCYSELSRATKNPALCEKLPDVSDVIEYSNRGRCYFNLAQIMKDPSLCNNVPTDIGIYGTQGDATRRDVCYWTLAKETNNATLCDNLSLKKYNTYDDITIKEVCIKEVMWRQ